MTVFSLESRHQHVMLSNFNAIRLLLQGVPGEREKGITASAKEKKLLSSRQK